MDFFKIYFLCGAADFGINLYMLKGLRNPAVGADGEERDPAKGTHKKTTDTLGVFSLN